MTGDSSDLASPLLSSQTFALPAGSELGEGEVLLRLEGATLCNSDLHTLLGRRKEPTPSVLGHEGCGTVLESSRAGVARGERVTFSVTDVCGDCELCREGPQQKCLRLAKYGHSRQRPGEVPLGCYSTHILLGRGTAVVSLPPALDITLATPVNCALATMVAARAAARQHGLTRRTGERRVLIFGAGLLGLYGCALFKEDGLKVFVSDPVPARRQEAVKFGAEEAVLPDLKYDAVVEVCGIGSVVKTGLSLLRPGGVVVVVGCVTPDSDLGLSGDSIVRACASIVGVHNYDQAHLATAVKESYKAANGYQGFGLLSCKCWVAGSENLPRSTKVT